MNEWTCQKCGNTHTPSTSTKCFNCGTPASDGVLLRPVVTALSRELEKVTRGFTLPLVMRVYEANEKGERAFADEGIAFAAKGYEPTMMTEDGGHIHAGRLLLTGGFSVFAGKRGIRSGGKRTVTWKKVAP